MFTRLKEKYSKKYASVHERRRFWIKFSVGALTLVFLPPFIFGLVIYQRLGLSEYAPFVKDFLSAPDDKLVSVNGRTNFLILGKGGEGHEAPELTDTLIFASLKKGDGITMISLPRDIWLNDLKIKINSAYYWGKINDGNGMSLAKTAIEQVVGLPIHYAVVIDFAGFERIVDALGGVEIDVENGFTDRHYPIPGKENDSCGGDPNYSCRYETVEFSPGVQRMDGAVALKFSRSRYAEGDEGTDLARAARQQKVILAIKDRLLQPEILTSSEKLLLLKEVGLSSVESDMDQSAMAVAARYAYETRGNIRNYVLPEELLENPKPSKDQDFLYVFTPKTKNFSQIHSWMNCVVAGVSENCD